MKKSLLITAAMFCGVVAFAQQQFQPSQYLQNIYVLNPAASGLTDYVDVNLSYRQQWAGFNGAPQTYYITGTSLIGKGGMGSNRIFALRTSDPYISTDDNEVDVDKDGAVVNRKVRHAIGASFMVDKAGAFRTNSGGLSYALHLPMSEKVNLSAGVKVNYNQLVFDQNLAKTLNPDQALNNVGNGTVSNGYVDANFGLLLYGDNFYAGYSTGNLFQNKLDLNNITTDQSTLKMHHYISGAYRFALSESLGLTPATLIKITSAPVSFDATLKLDLQRKFWLGASVRPGDAVVAFLGVRVNNTFNIGYSYDYTTSKINKVSNGSHEFVLNIMLGK